jgi:hypothetical protein
VRDFPRRASSGSGTRGCLRRLRIQASAKRQEAPFSDTSSANRALLSRHDDNDDDDAASSSSSSAVIERGFMEPQRKRRKTSEIERESMASRVAAIKSTTTSSRADAVLSRPIAIR